MTYILKKGQSWFVGLPETTASSISAVQNAEESSAVDVAHTKDSNGDDAMSVFLNGQTSLTVSGVTTTASVPASGEELTYNNTTYVITNASVAYNNTGTGAIVTITAIGRDAWGTTTA